MSVIKGNSFEIILDSQTKRKFFSSIAFHDDERFFAAEAEKTLPRNPQHTYVYLSQLLGKLYNSSSVSELQPHLLYSDSIVANEERGTVSLRYEDSIFAVEDLVGMIFRFARQTAENYVNGPATDVVITVPPHFTVEERAALIEAAQLGGFHVLSLINDGTAVALHYAFGKRFEEPKTVLFYDMGHSYTRATLVEFHSVVIKKGSKNMTQPTTKVKAVAYDAKLGGRDFDYRLAEYLGNVAVEQMKAKGIKSSLDELKANKRVWSRLIIAANQAKTVLSANSETLTSIEGLVGNYDLRTTVGRSQLEELCADLFLRASNPVQEVLAKANVSINEVSSVEIVGGNIRIPRVQAALKEALGISELSRTLNGDEAAVLGAVFYAAQLSTAVRVGSQHKVKDAAPYGVTATIALEKGTGEEQVITLDEQREDDKYIDFETKGNPKILSLFKPFSKLGAKKSISFKENVTSFAVELSYDNETDLPLDTPHKLALYKVEDMEKLKKYNYTGKPKITLSFRLTTSGLVDLEKAEAEVLVIKYPEPEPEPEPEPSSTHVPNTQDGDDEETEESDEPEGDSDETTDLSKHEGKDEEDTERAKEQSDDDSNVDEEEETKKKEKEEKKRQKKLEKERKKKAKSKKPKKTVHKIILTPVIQKLGIPERSYVEKARASSLLKQWDAKEIRKREKADAKNDLETYIYNTKEKMWDEELEKVSTEEQREEVREALSTAADWLETDGTDVSTKEYVDKKKELEKLANPIFERQEELTKRPLQVAMLSYLITNSRKALENITENLKVEVEEREGLLNLIDEAEGWLNTKLEEQEHKLPHEEPAFLSAQVSDWHSTIEKILRKLMKRKPRPTPTPTLEATLDEAAGSEGQIKEEEVAEEHLAEESVWSQGTKEEIL